jgi:hypothetical protein
MRQARRAAATSGRSRSAACWVFFSRQARGDQEPPEGRPAHRNARGRQPAAQFADREVRLGRQHRLHARRVPCQLRTLAPADALGLQRAMPAPALHQLDHEARADLELGRGRPARRPGLDRAHHPFAQIHRIRSCHSSLASLTQQPV